MNRLQLAAFDGPAGPMLADWSPVAQGLTWGTHQYGYGALTAFIPMSAHAAWRWYAQYAKAHLEVNAPAGTAWEGRLEDVILQNDGIQIAGFGYWNEFLDLPYTALWNRSGVAGIRPVTEDELSDQREQSFQFDNNNRIYITLVENTLYNPSTGGSQVFFTPHRGERGIQIVKFDYEFNLSNVWTARLVSYDDGFVNPVVEWQLVGDGTLQTGTVTEGLTNPKDLVIFELRYTGAGALGFIGETGTSYLKFTDVSFRTTISVNLYADEIAEALLSFVAANNGSAISDSTSLIQSPQIHLSDELYEDKYPADILLELIKLGDNQTPPRHWETGVFGRRLHFRPRGSAGRTFYIDLAEMQLEQSLNQLRNSAYAVFQNSNNVTRRTTTADDTTSQARYGLTRRAAVGASTTSEDTAEVLRDAYLADRKAPVPRAQLGFSELYNEAGARVPLYVARSGDTLIARNLPPTLSTEIDRLRSFRLAETQFDVDNNRLVVTPEQPLPSLDVLVAQQAEG